MSCWEDCSLSVQWHGTREESGKQVKYVELAAGKGWGGDEDEAEDRVSRGTPLNCTLQQVTKLSSLLSLHPWQPLLS